MGMNVGIYAIQDDDSLHDTGLCWQVIVPKKYYLEEHFAMINWCKATFGTHWGGDWNWADSGSDYRFRHHEDAMQFYITWA